MQASLGWIPVSSDFTGFLEDLLLRGLARSVAGRGLRRILGLAPKDPRKEVAGLVLFTTFLGGVLDLGERVLLSTLLVHGVSLLLISLSSLQSIHSRDGFGGCRGCPRR